MFDKLDYDKIGQPDTSFVAELLSTQAGFRWVLDFFGWARQSVGRGQATEENCFEEFKATVTQSLSGSGSFSIRPKNVDWAALFDFYEELTRPTEPTPWSPAVTLRAPRRSANSD